MDGDGSSVGTSRVRKAGGTRRSWNEKEEDILMQELKELVASGCWKSENGFRLGYCNKLEEKMLQRMPGTDIRATSHINSKIQTWKKLHGCLQTALGETGCGFNTVMKILDVSDEAWAKVLKKDSSFGNMRYKSWPYYEDWLEVFGSDRANGSTSENVIDVVNELFKGDNQSRNPNTEPMDDNVNPDVDYSCDMDVTSESVGVDKKSAVPKSSKRKSPSTKLGDNKELIDAIGSIFKSSDDRLENIVNVIGYEAKLARNRNDVYTVLESIQELSMDECLTATDMLCMNTRRLDMFMGLPIRARYRYVQKLLAGDFGTQNASTSS